MEQYKELKIAIDSILNTSSIIRRRKRSESDKKMELFKQVINGLEEIQARSYLASYELNIDMNNYDEKFLEVIDALIYMNYGKDCYQLVSFYLFERINPEDGSINPVLIEETGEEVFLENAYDLYNLMRRVNPKIE
jgi:hypothetical protein